MAAMASRTFYAAGSEAGVCIQRTITFPASDFRSRCFTFAEVAVHAARYQRLMGLTVTYFMGYAELADTTRNAAAKQLLDMLSAVLPLALEWTVRLEVTMPMEYIPRLLDALCHEAPRLRTLRIDCREGTTESRAPPLAKLPDSFLGGCAPNIRRVNLAGIDIGQLPLAAFSIVRRVCLSYLGEFPDLRMGEHFPSAAHVELESFGWVDKSRDPHVTLAGLPLEVLSVLDMTRARDALLSMIDLDNPLCTIPEVHVSSMGQPKWDTLELALPATFGALALRVIGCRAKQLAYIMISPHDLRWRRAALVHDWESEPMSPLRGFAFLGNITYLRFDVNALQTLFGHYVILEALERIKIDVYPTGRELFYLLWPWDQDIMVKAWESDPFCGRQPAHILGCPRLKQITLFTVLAPLSVDSREAAMLGRALGWESAELPKLTLVGVTLSQPVASALLAQAYSSVESRESAGIDSQEDSDSGYPKWSLAGISAPRF